jgi:hypothetical protein
LSPPPPSGTVQPGRLRPEPFLVAIALAASCFPIPGDDHWWHLSTGRLVLETGQIPHRDPFSFTFGGAPWANWEWLAGVVMYLAWAAAGPLGLTLLRGLVWGGTLVLLLSHWRRRSGGDLAPAVQDLAATLLGGLALVSLQLRVADRPHTYAFLLLALAHGITRGLCARWSWPRAGLLFGLFVVWANFHPSWILGLGLCGAGLLDTALAPVWSQGRPGWRAIDRRRLLLALLLGSSTLVTPHAAHYVTALREIFRGHASVEWLPLSASFHLTHVPLLAFAAVALAWGLTLAGAFRRRELLALGPLQQVVLAGALLLAFRHGMLAPVFTLVALPYLRPALPRPLVPNAGWPSRAPLLATGLALVVTLTLAQTVRVRMGGFGFGVDAHQNPVAAVAMMAHRDLGGRVLCSSKDAHGYVTFQRWPEATVYIDGRVPQVYPQTHHDRYLQVGDARVLDQEIERYGIDHVLLVRGLFAPVNVGMAAALRGRGDFDLVYWDEDSALWSRRWSPGWVCATCRPFQLLDPYRLAHRAPDDRLTDSPALREELAHLEETAAWSPFVRQVLAAARAEAGLAEPSPSPGR